MPDFLLPDLGEGLDEAEVVAWHVAVGDRVTVDQAVVEVETAKAVVDVPIPYEGVVSVLHAAAGEVVEVGSPLISVLVEVEPSPGMREPGVVTPDHAEPPAVLEASGPAGSEGAAPADDAEGASGSVLIGYGTSAALRSRRGRAPRRGARVPAAAPAPVALVEPVTLSQAGAVSEPLTPSGTGGSRSASVVAVSSPLVRRLARDGGLDLTNVAGTGHEGLVRRIDVEGAMARARAVVPEQAGTAPGSADGAPPPTAPPEGAPSPAGGPDDDVVRIPLRGLRRTVAEKLTRSRREIPEATVWVDVDATAALAARAALNARSGEARVSLLALLARFAVLGLRRHPELGGRVEAEEIVVPSRVNLGFAAQTERGLVVPVVRDAHRLSTRQLSAALAQKTAAAREGRLAPADLTGGTFTVNNYGTFGVDGSAAIINHPEVAILGLGRIVDRPWVVDGQLAVRQVTQLTLAFDHRACDGGTAGGFLRYVADCLEDPAVALGDL